MSVDAARARTPTVLSRAGGSGVSKAGASRRRRVGPLAVALAAGLSAAALPGSSAQSMEPPHRGLTVVWEADASLEAGAPADAGAWSRAARWPRVDAPPRPSSPPAQPDDHDTALDVRGRRLPTHRDGATQLR